MTDITCPECGTKQNKSFKFCKHCGASLSHITENESSEINEKEPKNDNNADAGFNRAEENSSDIRYCYNCGSQIASNAKFCPDCGKATEMKKCPKCGNITSNENFCNVCGYRINPKIKVCRHCESHIDADVKVCPNCGAEIAGKNAFLAFILSFLFPGLGQLYNNQNHKAVVFIIAYIISLILVWVIIGAFFALLIWIYGMYDAFVTAKAINNGQDVEDRIF